MDRFIPTYMGNACETALEGRDPTVHPHVHGERWQTVTQGTTTTGSSPRTWGTLIDPHGWGAGPRFIPTYMGNAVPRVRETLLAAVHPHVHGERSTSTDTGRSSTGSSPRTWGTQDLTGDLVAADRFIPTYMGNASARHGDVEADPVHPHVHGERGIGEQEVYRPGGSSPRTWGTPGHPHRVQALERFIPTYMGNAEGEQPGAGE